MALVRARKALARDLKIFGRKSEGESEFESLSSFAQSKPPPPTTHPQRSLNHRFKFFSPPSHDIAMPGWVKSLVGYVSLSMDL